MSNAPTAVASERARLDRLTKSGEPKQNLSAVVAIVTNLARHADERTAFYAAGDMHDVAEEWSELAVEADYRLECIAAETWVWS